MVASYCYYISFWFFFFFAAYNDKVVAFLRQPNVGEILQEKYSTYNNSTRLKEKINKIRSEGTEALDRLSNDVDLIILLRLVC